MGEALSEALRAGGGAWCSCCAVGAKKDDCAASKRVATIGCGGGLSVGETGDSPEPSG
jgi:hypothetical protein